MERRLNRMIQVGAFTAGIAVTLGAMGAHLISDSISPTDLAIYEIGVRYQFYHAIAILVTAAIYSQHDRKGLKWTYRFFLVGMFVFSGSLYVLSISQWAFGTRLSWLGAITPIGGLFFIIGWISFFLSFFRKQS